jgi:hypothetical protein
MRACDISLSSLLPSQEYLTVEKVELLRVSTAPLPPIVTLPYGYSSLILDGHHRAAAYYRRGALHVPALVVESDVDIPKLNPREGCWFCIPTIEQLLDKYFSEWYPECRDAGIESFYDLLIRNNLNSIPKGVPSRAYAEL